MLTIKNTLITISNILSMVTMQDQSIESAVSAHKLIFIIYVISLLFTLVLTVLLWKASNKAQDAVINDAKLQISKINLSSEKITKENIELRTKLEQSISEATIEKQKLSKMQIEVAEAKQKQSEAEISLEELKVRIKYRNLTQEQGKTMVEMLSGKKKGHVSITAVMGNAESSSFANQLHDIFKESKWAVPSGIAQAMFRGRNPVGIILNVNGAGHLGYLPDSAISMLEAFNAFGFHVDVMNVNEQSDEDVPDEHVNYGLTVGIKP